MRRGGEECPPEPDRSQGYVWPLYPSYEIYSAKPDGSDLIALTDNDSYDAEATVCPTDGSIIFTSDRDGDLELYRMDADGGNVTRLTHKPGYDGGAFFSTDCTQIVWRASRPETQEELDDFKSLLDRHMVRPSRLEIFVANADGSDVTQVTDLGGAAFAPYFHPSGKRVLFSSNHGAAGPREFDIWAVKHRRQRSAADHLQPRFRRLSDVLTGRLDVGVRLQPESEPERRNQRIRRQVGRIRGVDMSEPSRNESEVVGDSAVGVQEFFDALRTTSPLRVIQITGPSVFETICEVDSFSLRDQWLNAITPQYHWHLNIERFKHLTTRDTIHERSGRRVLFFELRETADQDPFLLIYLHRGKDEEFKSDREHRFLELHERCADGIRVEVEA